jgi:hypothetical protein
MQPSPAWTPSRNAEPPQLPGMRSFSKVSGRTSGLKSLHGD